MGLWGHQAGRSGSESGHGGPHQPRVAVYEGRGHSVGPPGHGGRGAPCGTWSACVCVVASGVWDGKADVQVRVLGAV